MTSTTPLADAGPATTAAAAPALRRLYLTRFVFAVAWAALFALTASPFGTVALVLVVLYPAFDVLAAVLDARAGSGSPRRLLGVNVALSTAAAVALAVVGTGDVGEVLAVWGTWAVVSGVVQLAVGLRRRSMAGHLPMVLSGAISVLAGGSFLASAHDATSLGAIAGYATLGGVFFGVSALRLGREK